MHSVSRIFARRGMQLSKCLSTTATRATATQMTPAQRDQWYPKLGNRDIVGYGFNGNPVYVDKEDFPAPAIRFKENTPEILALREKETGDWKNLTLEEKKALYRASFCQTFAEIDAPTGEWKTILAGFFFGLSLTLWCMAWMKAFVYPALPGTINKEYQEKEVQNMIRQRQGAIEGISSNYDYEAGKWK